MAAAAGVSRPGGEKGRAGRASRAGRELAQQRHDRLQAIHRKWCERNPARAAEERELRRQRREGEAEFGHKANGTVETHVKARATGVGPMVRLYRSGAITIQQWGASLEIAAAYERVAMGAGVPTAWAIERVDRSASPEQAFESLGGVWNELAYSRWRRALPVPGPVLAMIVEDRGLDAAARQFSMHKRRAKRLLIDALDLWSRLYREARGSVDEGDLAAAHEALIAA